MKKAPLASQWQAAAEQRNSGRASMEIAERLREAGLRPTRQRVALAELLFGAGDRHVTAEDLHEEAVRARVPVSLATVYNTLNQFTAAHLLREVAIDGSKTYFDTNTSNHYHFYVEDDSRLVDISGATLTVLGLPDPPEGTVISRIDVIVRLSGPLG
jgi:Fur family iron response transcriptional regulator